MFSRFSVHAALWVAFAIAASFPMAAQALLPRPTEADYLEADQFIFRSNEVTVVEITIDPADLQFLYDNPENEEKKPCDVRWKNSATDEVITQVGIRSRGNLSRGAPRRSWKLDFNEFVLGRDFHKLEEMDLNGDNNDPTLLRRRMAHELLRRMGLPTPRTSYVAIYFNGVFASLNINVEAVDEEFANSWFGNKNGNLYKCLYQGEQASLRYRSQEDYQTMGGGNTYRETNNDPASDYTDLKQFIDFLNNRPNATVYSSLHDNIEVDGVLRYLAANVALGSWDDYWYGSNNYYLYQDEDNGLFVLIPYDYDNCLGIDYFNTNWATRNFDNWGNGGYGAQPAPLVDELFNHSEWRRQYRRYARQAAAILADPAYQALPAQWHALILPYFDGTIESGGTTGTITSGDQHVPYFMDYNLPSNFNSSLDAHCHGLLPFIVQRAATLTTQLNANDAPPLPRVFINEVLASNGTTNTDNAGEAEDWIELFNDEDIAVDLSGWHLTDTPTSPTLYRIPDGTTIPAKGRLLIWADNTPAQQDAGNLHATFRLGAGGEMLHLLHNEAMGKVLVDSLEFPAIGIDDSYGRIPDGSTTLAIMPCPSPIAANSSDNTCGGGVLPPLPRLFINEFMASNTSTIQDNAGEFDDWIEIYNDEATTVDLTGLYLSDSLGTPKKWAFPDGTSIEAKSFLLVWADSTIAQSAVGFPHTSWGLGAGGESIGLYDSDANENRLIDSVTFGAQVADVSTGRFPNLTGAFVAMACPTPGIANTDPINCNGGGELPPLPKLHINEFMASNSSTIQDNTGEFDDWIEIYNDEETVVDLSSLYLTDSLGTPKKWAFPVGTSIDAKSFLLVWADSTVAQSAPGFPHTSWGLGAGGESIGLYDSDANLNRLIDSVTFGAQSANVSTGRFPNLTGAFVAMNCPTPGANNTDPANCGGGGEPRVPPRVFINEFMASNLTVIQDNMGEYADWVELYNDETTAVNLSGLYLTDSLASPKKWQFPPDTSIAAKGFLIVWTDSTPAQSAPGAPHASFSLSSTNGEDLGLFDNDENQNQAIHTFSFGPQADNVSQGLLPDGVGNPGAVIRPTPGATNVVPDPGSMWLTR